MALSEIDRNLLAQCLARKPRSWEDFVDRFLGLVIHVINHTAQSRSIRLSTEDREDLAAEVFLAFVNDDLAVLRHFRGASSLASYLTVISRRVVVRQLLRSKSPVSLGKAVEEAAATAVDQPDAIAQRISDRDQVQRLMQGLSGPEAEIVRLYHLEGKSYQEISTQIGIPENSVGPTLSRARAKMRRVGANMAHA
jgi:RNA polymerase sigma-70 factor (ECF subfamily)